MKAHYVANVLLLSSTLFCIGSSSAMETISDIKYASVNNRSLMLDLFLPDNISKPDLIVWIHGGAWSFGSKEDVHVVDIVSEGFALASIDFRNSPEAQFPAQVHDIKGAIRFLRAKADEYGYNPEKIIVWGYSSGGHLAALVGTTNGDKALEGNVGDYPNISSDVQAIVDYSGPSNFQTILQQSTPHGISVRAPALEQLLGKPVEDPLIQNIVIQASPVFQASEGDPPLLIMHGVQDNQVPINQSIELQAAYLQQGLSIEVEWLVEAQHTSGEYFKPPYIEQVAAFLRNVL